MNTHMTGLSQMVIKKFCILVLWTKVAAALEVLRKYNREFFFLYLTLITMLRLLSSKSQGSKVF